MMTRVMLIIHLITAEVPLTTATIDAAATAAQPPTAAAPRLSLHDFRSLQPLAMQSLLDPSKIPALEQKWSRRNNSDPGSFISAG